MNRMLLIYVTLVASQFIQQQTLSVLIIQKQMIVIQQDQLNNLFQTQRDGILIYSLGGSETKHAEAE
jgi:hypothetical protein